MHEGPDLKHALSEANLACLTGTVVEEVPEEDRYAAGMHTEYYERDLPEPEQSLEAIRTIM